MVTAIYHRTSRVITWRATRGRISHLAANGICFLPPAAFPRLVHSILHAAIVRYAHYGTEKPRSFMRGWRDESSARGGRGKFRKCRDRLKRMTKRGGEQIFDGSINGRHLRSLILIFVLTTREEKRGINLETRVGWLSPQRLLSTAIWKGFDEWRWSNFEIPLWLITTANQYFNYHVQFSMQNVIEDN